MKCNLKTIVALLILSCLIITAGCRKKAPPPSTSKVNTKPQSIQDQQDVLRILIWEGYAPEEYVDLFKKQIEAKYGRKVEMVILIAESVEDFYSAIRNKNVDLVTISHHTIKDARFNFIAKGLILPFDLENIPNYVNMIPDLKNAKYHVSEGKTYGIPIANGPYGLAYNKDKIPNEPESWQIFWEPEYKGKYILGAHEYLYNVNITAMVLGYPRESISSFDALNNKAFKDKLREFAANANSFWIGVDKPDDLLGMSLAASWGDSLSSLNRIGERWEMANPKEGTMWWIDEYAMTWALSEKPFLKKVAEEWINLGLTPEFQVDHLVREVQIYPVTTNIIDKLTAEEKTKIQVSSLPGAFTKNRILQHTYSERDRNGLKLLWDQAMEGISIE